MNELKITRAETQESLDRIYDLYMEAFPKEERKPFERMVTLQQEGRIWHYLIILP